MGSRRRRSSKAMNREFNELDLVFIFIFFTFRSSGLSLQQPWQSFLRMKNVRRRSGLRRLSECSARMIKGAFQLRRWSLFSHNFAPRRWELETVHKWKWVPKLQEVDEMLSVFDRNKDGFISYSEFRLMLGAKPGILWLNMCVGEMAEYQS